MTRQAFLRVLLSLLLLVSQHMASAHVMSHLAGSIERPAATQSVADDDVLASAVAHEQSCSQCLAFAQLSGPLGATPLPFAVPDHATAGVVPGDLHAGASRTILAFQSRGPPVLS